MCRQMFWLPPINVPAVSAPCGVSALGDRGT